jgi:1-pyrroline-5-carboxylate dehydrogenase
LDEALGLANVTDYGLISGSYSEDPEEIEMFFNRIEFGVC